MKWLRILCDLLAFPYNYRVPPPPPVPAPDYVPDAVLYVEPKPRIRYLGFGYWTCNGDVGRSPREAYLWWRWLRKVDREMNR